MNAKRSRIEPVFTWLAERGGGEWPVQLLALCEGLHLPMHTNGKVAGRRHPRARKNGSAALLSPGAVLSVELDRQRKVKASPARLAWMIRDAHRLVPGKWKKTRELAKRVLDNPKREEALELLDAGCRKGVPKKLMLEGPVRADCLIECEHLLIWIEGTRDNFLATSTKWDNCRDQFARDLDAVGQLAKEAQKEYCLILCHEHELRHHEVALIEGYRRGTWSAGLPHLPPALRLELGQRIGTVTWHDIAAHWPELVDLPELDDLVALASVASE